MIINYNISFDTVCCACCKNVTSAHVSKEITDVKDYWICKKRQGIFAERFALLEDYLKAVDLLTINEDSNILHKKVQELKEKS